jgi:hypothetical protein
MLLASAYHRSENVSIEAGPTVFCCLLTLVLALFFIGQDSALAMSVSKILPLTLAQNPSPRRDFVCNSISVDPRSQEKTVSGMVPLLKTFIFHTTMEPEHFLRIQEILVGPQRGPLSREKEIRSFGATKERPDSPCAIVARYPAACVINRKMQVIGFDKQAVPFNVYPERFAKFGHVDSYALSYIGVEHDDSDNVSSRFWRFSNKSGTVSFEPCAVGQNGGRLIVSQAAISDERQYYCRNSEECSRVWDSIPNVIKRVASYSVIVFAAIIMFFGVRFPIPIAVLIWLGTLWSMGRILDWMVV